MKKVVLVFSAMLAVALITNKVNAQTAYAEQQAEASATIIAPIEIYKLSDLKFGNIAAGPTSGTVEISTDNMRTGTGGVTLIEAGNTSYAAAFDISGYSDATFTIDIPSSITLYSGYDQMEVNNFVSSLGSDSQLDGSGYSFLTVGATLNVAANQAPGYYEGTFNVTVAYN